MDTKTAVRKYIEESMLMISTEKLADDASLLRNNVLDSTGILELATFLEDTFGIQVAETDLTPENLDSLNRIDAYVGRKVAA